MNDFLEWANCSVTQRDWHKWKRTASSSTTSSTPPHLPTPNWVGTQILHETSSTTSENQVSCSMSDCTWMTVLWKKVGVRILPGTHKQSVFMMLFRKFPMFFTHTPDPKKIPLIVKRGDLTIHDGRAWHRTAQATLTGKASQRRTMYMAYIDEPYQPRDENSKMPLFKSCKNSWGRRALRKGC